jgi:hypothetical protein
MAEERLIWTHVYNILASQQGFADLDKQFDLNQLRGKGFDSVDDKTFSDIDKDTLKRNLEDARNLIWRYDGYLHQYLDDSLLGSVYATETLGEDGSRVQHMATCFPRIDYYIRRYLASRRVLFVNPLNPTNPHCSSC